MTGSKTESGVEVWSSRPGDDQAVDSGLLELIGEGRSFVSHLRAVRQTFPEIYRTRPMSANRLTETFSKRVVDALRRYIESVSRPSPVTIYLEMAKGECQVKFIDEREEVLQIVTLENTTDLISLLRWPMIQSGPMFTDSGTYVTWSVFEDIQFGDLDFLKPYVSYKAARSTPEELPKRIAQFFEEAKSISVGIEHDKSRCPIAIDNAVDHGACWRITLPLDCPKQVRRQLGRTMTGEEINGLLAPEKLYAGRLYQLEVLLPAVSEKDESIVFHEERYIRMLLRGKGLNLKRLEPGTYLNVAGQKWMVDISWDDETHLRWKAQSTVSGLFFSGEEYIIKLTHGRGAKSEYERISEIITSKIHRERIANYIELKDIILSGLRLREYSRSSPLCELRVIKSTKTVFIFGVFLVEGIHIEPLARFTIETTGKEAPDTIIETVDVSLSEGDLSHYSILNTELFMKKLTKWVTRNVPIVEYED
nr:MAG: hypothetical protein AM325_01305 [Candidatus Thorarchaeota archaeon SMTZ1-45]